MGSRAARAGQSVRWAYERRCQGPAPDGTARRTGCGLPRRNAGRNAPATGCSFRTRHRQPRAGGIPCRQRRGILLPLLPGKLDKDTSSRDVRKDCNQRPAVLYWPGNQPYPLSWDFSHLLSQYFLAASRKIRPRLYTASAFSQPSFFLRGPADAEHRRNGPAGTSIRTSIRGKKAGCSRAAA